MPLVWIQSSGTRYPAWLELRRKILREPLGLEYSDEDLRAERDQQHLLAIENDEVVGGLIVTQVDSRIDHWKIRQVAVADEMQGRGIGRELVERVLEEARLEGVKEITLHSRLEVAPFYENFGFTTEGDTFEEIGIPHIKMRFGGAST